MSRIAKRFYYLYDDGALVSTVTSERAARAAARTMLGVSRVSEHPTNDGWLYQSTNADEDAPAIRVRVA